MSNQINHGVRQQVLDTLFDVSELETHTLRVVNSAKELTHLLSSDDFVTSEAVRRELVKAQAVINTLLERAINDLWDVSLAIMPEHKDKHNISASRGEELIRARMVEIQNLRLQQEV